MDDICRFPIPLKIVIMWASVLFVILVVASAFGNKIIINYPSSFCNKSCIRVFFNNFLFETWA